MQKGPDLWSPLVGGQSKGEPWGPKVQAGDGFGAGPIWSSPLTSPNPEHTLAVLPSPLPTTQTVHSTLPLQPAA